MFLFAIYYSLSTYHSFKFKTYLYWALSFCFAFIFFFLEGLSLLFVTENLALGMNLAIAEAVTSFPVTITIILSINYTLKESFARLSLIPVFSIGVLLCYSAFQPGAVGFEIINGYLALPWLGLFGVLANLLLYIFLFYIFLWSVRIWRNAPFEIRKEANIFLVFGCECFIVGTITNILLTIYPTLLWLGNLSILTGLILCTYAIIREPKLLFVLPFTPYRLIVEDRKGAVLYEHVWSSSELGERIVSRVLRFTQPQNIRTEELRGLIDIHTSEGIVIYFGTELIATILIVSKSSRFLLDLIEQFALDFEEIYRKFLEEPPPEQFNFAFADELLKKHFFMFPSRIIDEKTHPLFLSKEVYTIPEELEAKLRQVLKDEKEFETIKCEIQRTLENQIASDFLNLYEELQDELKDKEDTD